MPDMHHITVFHDVLLAFQSQRAAIARFSLGAGVQQLVPVDGFGANEVMFQIGVDRSCRIDGFRSALHGPGAALIFAHGEE